HSLLCVPGTFAPVAHSCLCEMSLPDEEDCHAGAIEEATDGRGRGARCQARRTLEREPQGRLAAHGGEHERAAIARVRPYQAKGSAAQAQGLKQEITPPCPRSRA